MHITGNYIQYLVINHNGKEYEKLFSCILLFSYSVIYIIESFHLHTINHVSIFFNLSWFFEKINKISKCLARQKENATLVSVT